MRERLIRKAKIRVNNLATIKFNELYDKVLAAAISKVIVKEFSTRTDRAKAIEGLVAQSTTAKTPRTTPTFKIKALVVPTIPAVTTVANN